MEGVIIIKITVCIGSGCHVKGSKDIIKKLKLYIEEVDRSIDLEACFCKNHCTEGVVVKFDDDLITNVTKDNIIYLLNKRLAEEG